MTKRTFSKEEIDLIHRTMMAGASKDDLALFVSTCERTGLDPFARQIMPSSRNVKKNEKWVMVWTWLVTIDGLRKIAVDSGDYEGQEGPWWCGKDGQWREVWNEDTPCYAAKVMVHRRGFRTGLTGIAKYESYVQKTKEGAPNQVWKNLGDHMTAKCAEALALRRAYPNEMAGLYTDEEMEQVERESGNSDRIPTPPHAPKDTPEPPQTEEWTDDQIIQAGMMLGALADEMMEHGATEEQMAATLAKPRGLVGDTETPFRVWENRFLALHKRTAEAWAK